MYGILSFKDLHSEAFSPEDGRPEYMNYGAERIVTIDTKTLKAQSSNSKVYNTSINDVKDYKNYGRDCSKVLTVTKWGYLECLFVFN